MDRNHTGLSFPSNHLRTGEQAAPFSSSSLAPLNPSQLSPLDSRRLLTSRTSEKLTFSLINNTIQDLSLFHREKDSADVCLLVWEVQSILTRAGRGLFLSLVCFNLTRILGE